MLLLAACAPDTAPLDTHDVLAPVVDEWTPPPDDEEEDDPSPPDTGDPPVTEVEEDPPALFINEVMVSNGFTLYVEGEYPDWVEIYNASLESVALSRITLVDGSGRVWLGTEGEIYPGGYQLVYADGLGEGLHAPFSLDGDGDTLVLSVDGRDVDRISTGELDADISWARFPDGGEWSPTIWTTAGESNGDTPSDTLDTDSTLFGLYGVHQVSLDLDSSAMSTLRSSYYTYVEGGIDIDGSELASIGVRLRGSSTLRSIDQKCSFKVDFNRYEPGQSYRGKKKLHLINMIWDASHVREYMSYYVMGEFGVPSARNSYAWVDVSGTDKGLYMLSEVYDDEFLEWWYGNNDGYLWEPGSGDLTGYRSWSDCEEGDCDTSVISPIASLLSSSATDGNVESMRDYLDLDAVLRMIAVEKAVGQWDGYCSPHNYRVYWDPDTNLVSMMPSSLDLTFDNLGYNYGDDYFSCGGSVLSWCLSNETCEADYIVILEELADRLEGDMLIEETMDDISELIDSFAVDDATTGLSGYTYAQHVSEFQYVRDSLSGEPDDIRSQIDAR